LSLSAKLLFVAARTLQWSSHHAKSATCQSLGESVGASE
jgi:hypothetical protein